MKEIASRTLLTAAFLSIAFIPVQIAAEPNLSYEQLSNLIYQVPDDSPLRDQGITQIQLNDGHYLSSNPQARIGMSETWASGDLNNDGFLDAVVVLYFNYGGNHSFPYLAIVVNEQGKPQHHVSYVVGNVSSLKIEQGHVVVDMQVYRPGDRMCCLTGRETRVFRLE